MQSSKLFPALDLLTNPILLTETDGTVIYRSEIALKQLQIPHLGKKIERHFTRSGKKILRNYETALPAFLSYQSYDSTVTVFTDRFTLDERTVILFFFSHLFDFSLMEHQRNSPSRELLNLLSGERLATLAIASYERDDQVLAIENKKSRLDATRLLQKIVNAIITRLSHNGEKILYAVNDAHDILTATAQRTVANFGLNAPLPYFVNEGSEILVDIKPFALIFSQILILLAEVNITKQARIHITESEGSLLYVIKGRAKRNFHSTLLGDAESFSHVLPGSLTDLAIFKSLCQNQGYEFDFAMRSNEDDNLTLRLRIPIERRYALKDSESKEKEELLAFIDSITNE